MNLKLDWCSYQAAEYAVMHWHYSKCMPKSKNIYIGVWEENKFIGSIIFGLGGGNATSGKRFGINEKFRIVELERVALTKHITPVTKIISIAIRMLKKQSPRIVLIISYADPRQKHLGTIYQAGNWIYYGRSAKTFIYKNNIGKEYHSRTVNEAGYVKHFRKKVRCLKPSQLKKVECEGKFTYLMPLDKELKIRLLKKSKNYPKELASVV